ncbi:MAG: FHA domain-containing protein [bacterium]|nr:FHA domain-containing protein [bacterium]
MKDGHTRKLERHEEEAALDPFLATHRASLVIEKGPAAGEEFALETKQVVVGRGPEVDMSFNDDAMSREHVAFELQSEGFRARDLASTNGMRINGGEVLVADLKHGDAIEIGNAVLRYVVECIPKATKTHVIGD